MVVGSCAVVVGSCGVVDVGGVVSSGVEEVGRSVVVCSVVGGAVSVGVETGGVDVSAVEDG